MLIAANAKVFNLDNDFQVYIGPLSTAQISLTSNPTTGYSWYLIPPNIPGLKITNPQGTFKAPDKNVMGASGTQEFEITCTEECQDGDNYEITMIYSRPWEKDPGKIKNVAVSVTSDKNLI